MPDGVTAGLVPTEYAVLIRRPAMPKSLAKEAKAEWRRVVPELEEMGFLANVDRAFLIRYCYAGPDYAECRELLDKSGKVVRGQKNNIVRNPIWLLMRMLMRW